MPRRRYRLVLTAAAAVAATVVTACGSSGNSSAQQSGQSKAPTGSQSTTEGAYGTLPPASGTPVKGGTVTYGITSGAQPTYIMPVYPGSAWTVYNFDFQIPMFRPLYWLSVGNRPVLDPTLSLAPLPVYSGGGKTVTINLKQNYKWSSGKPVDANDVLFFIDVLRAAVKENASNFGPYTAGNFPDNVVSATAPSKYTVVLKLDKAYNPSWFTDTQLANITPMPSSDWNIAAEGGAHLDYTDPANAKKIYDYLDGQSKKLSNYAKDPLWQIVDGPFKLSQFNPTTDASTMVPNPAYGGPQKPQFDELKAVYFASSTAEFNALRSGKLSIGQVTSSNIPQVGSLQRAGYNVYGYPSLGFNYLVFNFADKTNNWDKVIGQLYIRQAFAHLSDQAAIIHGAYHDAAAPAYGPVPAVPATAYVPGNAATNPYPYSITAAKNLLTSHGWKVVPNGTTTCQNPGTAANQCGAGIPKGQKLDMTIYYTNDPDAAGLETTQFASAAKQIGVNVKPVAKTFNFIVDQYDDPVSPENNNKWQAENFGGYSLYVYPTSDTIFNTKASGNEGWYSDPTADKLIKASKFSSNPSAVRDEAAYLTKSLPGIFLPNQDLIFAWKGISGPPDSFANLTQYEFTPEYWYRTGSG